MQFVITSSIFLESSLLELVCLFTTLHSYLKCGKHPSEFMLSEAQRGVNLKALLVEIAQFN